MRTLNLGILAHVDAGKTSLTERLLHAVGVIDELGSVDSGSTQTDSMALERQRGITIKAAVVSFMLGETTVNLIDTPGHPDFIAEVERSLSVLDGAVLVVSAVEGVQAQTRVLMRALRRLRIPTVIFVNKVDRGGAQYSTLIDAIATRLTAAIAPMAAVGRLGSRDASVTALGPGDSAHVDRLAGLIADHDEAFLAAYVDDEHAISYDALRAELATLTRRALVHPVFFGSAITGCGIGLLMSGITELLPAVASDPDGPASGTVFKIERGDAGEKIAYVRMFSGTVRARDRVRFGDRARLGAGAEGKVTSISVFDRGAANRRASVAGGQIGMLWGLDEIVIGDVIGQPPPRAEERFFAPPTLQAVVVPARPADRGALYAALTQLAEQDPLINVRRDDIHQDLYVSLYGEVQKEVIQATLATEFNVDVTFSETSMICVERLAGTGAAAERLHAPSNPFLATIGLRVEPASSGAGVSFTPQIQLGSIPLAFLQAVETTVRETLGQGLYGWEIPDCAVFMTESGYLARQSSSHGTFDKSMSSTARDFRQLTPLVLMEALAQAGTQVMEPIHRFRLEIPADLYGGVVAVLGRLGAVPSPPSVRGAVCTLTGDIPATRVHELQQQLPSLTRGEGMLDTAFARYQPVRGIAPTRPRRDHNPLNRKEYLMRVMRVT